MSKAEKAKHDEYQAEDDLRTLGRADEIRADAKRMASCRRVHRKQSRSMKRIGRSLSRA